MDNTDKTSSSELNAFLFSALKETQDSIRAFDTKAQIVGIGYIFAIGIIGTIGSFNPDTPAFSSLTILFAWLIVILPIILFGAVLYPSRKMAPHLETNTQGLKRLYHPPMEYLNKLDDYINDVQQCDIKKELCFELMKLSALRELKRTRFLRALFAATISFILLFLAQLSRALHITIM